MPSHAHVPGCARLNIARLNAFRLNYFESVVLGGVGGIDRSRNMRIEGAAVQHQLNEGADTAAVTVHGFTPVAGQTLVIHNGDWAPDHQLFGGRILQTTVRYESKPGNVAWDLQGIDPTWLLNRRRVLAQFTGQSATMIVYWLVAQARGVTSKAVAIDLPVVDEITFQNATIGEALSAVAERIGAYWYLDYAGDLHFFISQTADANPITDANCRTSSDHQLTEDLSQVVTRVIARGASAGAAADIAAGSTELPVDLGDQQNFYNVTGGIAEAGPQRITYAAVRGLGAVGALVGGGNAPSNAPGGVLQASSVAASGLVVGAVYQYAVTYVTATGETSASPVTQGAISGAMPAPPTAPPTMRDLTYNGSLPGPVIGGVYHFRLVYRNMNMAHSIGPVGPAITYTGKAWELYVGPMGTTAQGVRYFPALGPPPEGKSYQLLIFRTVANAGPGGPFYSCGYIDFGTGNDWRPLSYMPPDGDIAQAFNLLPATGPAYNSLWLDQIPVSTLPAVTGRKVYRTVANGTQLKLVATINKTDTGYHDVTADAALGVNIPTTDTSGIPSDTAQQVVAGSTTLPVSGTGPVRDRRRRRVGARRQHGGPLYRYRVRHADRPAGHRTRRAVGDGALWDARARAAAPGRCGRPVLRGAQGGAGQHSP